VVDFFIFESLSAECSRVRGGLQNPPLFNRKTARLEGAMHPQNIARNAELHPKGAIDPPANDARKRLPHGPQQTKPE
jgi:hypothetical protein